MSKSYFAIIKAGGKQYKVAKDDVVKIEKIIGNPGSEICIDEVLMLGNNTSGVIIGNPSVKGASVTAEILSQGRDEKVIIFKKKRRHTYIRKNGHRQHVTYVKIKDIITN